jgi:predicted PurR-regulated permease PerM
VSGGEVVGLVFAVFWAVLVCFLAFVMVRLAQVLREATRMVARVTDQTVPLLGEVTTTVTTTNDQLAKVDSITTHVQTITANANALTSTFAATLGGPLVKAAAYSYGVRKVLADRRHAEVEKRVRSEIKAARRGRKG